MNLTGIDYAKFYIDKIPIECILCGVTPWFPIWNMWGRFRGVTPRFNNKSVVFSNSDSPRRYSASVRIYSASLRIYSAPPRIYYVYMCIYYAMPMYLCDFVYHMKYSDGNEFRRRYYKHEHGIHKNVYMIHMTWQCCYELSLCIDIYWLLAHPSWSDLYINTSNNQYTCNIRTTLSNYVSKYSAFATTLKNFLRSL